MGRNPESLWGIVDNDATMSDAKGTKITEEAPSAGTKEVENNKDAIIDDVKEYKDTKETYGEGTLDIDNDREKVDKLMPSTPTKRMSVLKKTLKFTGKGKLSTPLSKGIKYKSSPVYFKSRSNKKLITKKDIYKIWYLRLTSN